MTRQRRLVKQVLCDSHAHLTAEEIYERAKEMIPEIALGTVYRNLGLLCASGEIVKIEVTGEACRYDGNIIPHEHIACTLCGRVDDINIEGLDELIRSRKDLRISGYMLTLYHVCEKCRENNENRG